MSSSELYIWQDGLTNMGKMSRPVSFDKMDWQNMGKNVKTRVIGQGFDGLWLRCDGLPCWLESGAGFDAPFNWDPGVVVYWGHRRPSGPIVFVRCRDDQRFSLWCPGNGPWHPGNGGVCDVWTISPLVQFVHWMILFFFFFFFFVFFLLHLEWIHCDARGERSMMYSVPLDSFGA